MNLNQYKNYCMKGTQHEGKQIIMLCLNNQCDNQRLCCLTCIDHLHRKHQLISLQHFQSMLSILTNQPDPHLHARVLTLLQQFNLALQKDMDRQIDSFVRFINKCKQKAQSIIDAAIESVSLNLTPQHINQLYQNLTNENVCKYLDLIREAESEAFKDPPSTQKTLASASAIFQRTNTQAQKHFTKGMEEVNASLQRLKKTFSHRRGSKPRVFSKTNKAACIEVSNQQTLAKRLQGSGSYPVVLMEQPLTEFNNSFTVTLKQQPGNKGCWVGVCALDIVKNFNFASCYGMGKGSWAIDQVGASHSSAFSWSHHDSNYNSQPKVGFQFHTGDTLTVRVNFQKSTVIFERGSQLYEMPIQLQLGQIYPFVGCTHLGDSWSIASG